MSRYISILIIGSFTLGCQGIRLISETEFTKQQRQQLFKLNADKTAALHRAIAKRYEIEVSSHDVPLWMKRFHYYPAIVNPRFLGLWYLESYHSHFGPFAVINGKHTATVVPLMDDKAAGLDSLQVALRRYPLTEIGPEVRDSIIKSFEATYR